MADIAYRTLLPLFDELQGERVLVRPYRESDAQALFDAVAESREHIRPWLPFADKHQCIEETRDWIIKGMADWLLRESLNLSMWERESGRFIGGTGLHPRNWDIGHFEIGYWVHASAQGHGYMSEVVRLLTRYAFDELKANRLVIRCDARNQRSAAVARRQGFVQEACLRNDTAAPDGSLRSTLVFALIPEDYAALPW
jgi:RimJ/RimL family protein N-acetyltransferase